MQVFQRFTSKLDKAQVELEKNLSFIFRIVKLDLRDEAGHRGPHHGL